MSRAALLAVGAIGVTLAAVGFGLCLEDLPNADPRPSPLYLRGPVPPRIVLGHLLIGAGGLTNAVVGAGGAVVWGRIRGLRLPAVVSTVFAVLTVAAVAYLRAASAP